MRILFDMWKHVSEKKILKRIESGYFWGASGLLMWGKVNLREIKKLVQGYRACVRSRIKKSDHHISKPTV